MSYRKMTERKSPEKKPEKCKECGRHLDEGRDLSPYIFVILFIAVILTARYMQILDENKKVECIRKLEGFNTLQELYEAREKYGNDTYWLEKWMQEMERFNASQT